MSLKNVDLLRLPPPKAFKKKKFNKSTTKRSVVRKFVNNDLWVQEIQKEIKHYGGEVTEPFQVMKIGSIAKKHLNKVISEEMGGLQNKVRNFVEDSIEARSKLNNAVIKYSRRYDNASIYKKNII